MLQAEYTRLFKKDFKRCEKRGLDMEEIQAVMSRLAADERLEPRFRDHILKGSYEGFGECHIRPDWLLVYLKQENRNAIVFVRTGTHADLFE
jgi:mRNA interferase YafQ